jgi:hypothetical protein
MLWTSAAYAVQQVSLQNHRLGKFFMILSPPHSAGSSNTGRESPSAVPTGHTLIQT